ncbi:glycosyltransferase family 4 protein [Paenibacillus chartarius]|uniref:Glycosyltransferase family 4 protein n=1 Tax=Paenibacillus chartarius TaxID=747481 RepID=A0ABV6DLH8_9BACL
MKIMLVNTLYHPNMIGGAEKSVQLLAEKVASEGHTPVVVSTTKQKDYTDIVNGIKVYYLRFRNLYWGIESGNKPALSKGIWHAIDIYNPLMKHKFNEILAAESPQIIHTNNLTGFSIVPWLCAKEQAIPVIHTLRDYSLMCVKGTMFTGEDNCSGRCKTCSMYTDFKKSYSNKGLVQHLTGNSQFIVDLHKQEGYFRGISSSRIFNGAELRKLAPEPTSTDGRDDKRRLKFLYMGRIEATKGVNLLLEAFQSLPEADLLLAGNINDAQISAKKERGEYPSNITFLGFVKPHDVLPQADAVIVPSLWHEPLPRVSLEAYSYGKPVIGSNRGGIPESIQDGVTGYIFDPAKPNHLLEILVDLIRNPEKLTRLTGNLETFLKTYDINITAKEYIALYEHYARMKTLQESVGGV